MATSIQRDSFKKDTYQADKDKTGSKGYLLSLSAIVRLFMKLSKLLSVTPFSSQDLFGWPSGIALNSPESALFPP